MKFPIKVNVLGSEYTILKRAYQDDEGLEGLGGYCRYLVREIVIADFKTIPSISSDDKRVLDALEKETIRHELIHAFLNESGLGQSTLVEENMPWSQNEEMVDWIAIQFPKIMKAYKEVGCI